MFKHVKRYVHILALIALLSTFLFPTYATAEKRSLTIGLQDNSVSLDPATHFEAIGTAIINQLYEKLVTFEADDLTKPIPEIAESWELQNDGKTWIFHLRKGLLFSNGNPIKADDVVFSLRRVVTLKGKPSWLLTQFGITEKSVTKIDDATVQIVLGKQYAPSVFFSCLTHPVAGIVDQVEATKHEANGDMGSAWLENHSAGSGRFVLTERTPGESAVLTANPNYQRKTAPIEQVILKNIQEPVEQAVLLENGNIDIAWDLQPDQVMRLEENPDIQIQNTPSFQLVYLAMNVKHEALGKSEVRDAIRYAIDYDGIIDFILQGVGEKIQTIIPKGLLGYNPAMPYNRNRQKAQQLLASAGYSGNLELELVTFDYSPWTDVALKIKSDLAKIGIRVKTVFQAAPQRQFVSRDFQLYLGRWQFDYVDPDAVVKPFAHSDSAGDDATVKLLPWFCNYVNLETSQLIDQAVQELDTQKREALYKNITDIMLDDGPFAILYTPMRQYGVRAEIRDLVGIPSYLLGDFPPLK